jgi:hypothetical protein
MVNRPKRLDWVRSPSFIKNSDWSAMIDMAVTAITGMFNESDAHLVEDLDPASGSGPWLSRLSEEKPSRQSKGHASCC